MLTCTIFLDPRYKLDFVDYIFKKIEPVEHIAEMKVESIQTQLYNIFFFENMNAQDYGHYKCFILCWKF